MMYCIIGMYYMYCMYSLVFGLVCKGVFACIVCIVCIDMYGKYCNV